MVGSRTPDHTYVWMDARGNVRASGPRARHWRKRLAGCHPLPDYDAKEAYERKHDYQVICEPLDIKRRVRTTGELIEVTRRLCEQDGLGPPLEWIEIPTSHDQG